MDWHNLADPPHGAVHIQHSLCGFLSVWICRKHTLMLRLVHFGWFLMSVKEKKKKVQSKSRRQYFMNLEHLHPSQLTFPVELIPNVSCGSLMSIGRISLAKRKVLGGEWEYHWARRPSLPIVKDISPFLTAQSISLLQGVGASLSLSQQVIALAAILAERQALCSS